MDVFLETERVVLRRFTEVDADNLVTLDGDPEVMRYLTGGPPTPRDVIEREILPAYQRYYERGDRQGHRRFPGVVPLPARGGRRTRRGRAWLSAAQGRMGQGLRHGGVARLDPQGL